MLHQLEKRVEQAVARVVRERFGVECEPAAEQPRQGAHGEIAVTSAFALAKELRKPPRAIAEEIASGLQGLEGVAQVEVAGGGFLNFRLDRGAYGEALLEGRAEAGERAAEGKIIVEHTNINPNKAAHIGHLRNAILGDTFVRMLRALGHRVEVQNYIDNTGVQVADVVAAFHYLGEQSAEEVAALTADDSVRFDYLCWDLYAKISQHYQENPETLNWRHKTLHHIEAGEGDLARLGHVVADAIVFRHLATMRRLGIVYDVLPRESEILHLEFWKTAFELLKQRGAIEFEHDGRNKHCWVMRADAFAEGSEDDKVIVRSNGTVTYVGKDIAYQLWKFGLLGKDFYYSVLETEEDGHSVWVTTAHPNGEDAPHFGGGHTVYNVIDSRQSYLQNVVAAGLRALGYHEQAERSVHFAYEMVALTPRCCVELGIDLSTEDARRPYIEVSGRKGLGVKADDLIDKLIENACREVASRHPDASAEEQRRVATRIATGALRYFMLKFTRNTVIAFDFQEALSFEGETGPYVQYAAVRAANILRKLEERGGTLPEFSAILTREAMARQLAPEDFWQLLLAASRAGSATERALRSGEPAHVAKYAFQLAQAFNAFYHDYPILTEEDPEKRAFLLWMTVYFRTQLEKTLAILGIEVPEYM